MPRQEIAIALTGTDNDTALACSALAMQQLGWPVLFAGENAVGGNTPRNWKTKGEQVVCHVDNSRLTMTSEMFNGELADLMGKNKKNCARFREAFENISATVRAEDLADIRSSLAGIRETTAQKIAEEERDAKEIDAAMNLSGSNLYVTYAIIAINVLVFILMIMNGAGLFDPNGYVHLKWGSNYGPLTLSGDWWRLLTNIFIHFGIIHLAMNMYCLYTVGVYLEPMLGKIKYAAVYICTGVLASVVSLWWHTEPANSAGASGPVFGVYGVFFALLTSNLIPKKIRQPLLQSIAIFVGYNLLYGLKGGIDNSAHIGGLLSGLVFGYAYVYGIRKEKAGQPLRWMVPAVIICTAAVTGYYIRQNEKPVADRASILNEINGASFKDYDRFNNKLSEFDKIHAEIDLALGDTTLTYEQLAAAIDKTALPLFEKATQLISSTKGYDISPAAKKKVTMLLQYLEMKKEEMELMKKICLGGDAGKLMPALNDIRAKAGDMLEKLAKL